MPGVEGAFFYDRPVSVTPIRLFGDPVLRTPAAPVVDFDRELRQLVADLTDTMFEAGGARPAPPHISVGRPVFTPHVGWEGDPPAHPHHAPLGEQTRKGD